MWSRYHSRRADSAGWSECRSFKHRLLSKSSFTDPGNGSRGLTGQLNPRQWKRHLDDQFWRCELIAFAGGSFNLTIDDLFLTKANLSDPITAHISDVVTGVPEPSTWAMMIVGFARVVYMTNRRRKRFTAFSAA